MRDRLNYYKPIIIVLQLLLAVPIIWLCFNHSPAFPFAAVIWFVIIIATTFWQWSISRNTQKNLNKIRDSLSTIAEESVISLPVSSIIVQENGEITWSNTLAKETLFPDVDLFGANLKDLIPGFDWNAEMPPLGFDVSILSHRYSAYVMKSKSTSPSFVICFVDDHQLKHFNDEYHFSQPYVLTFVIDNYVELFSDAKENERSHTMGQIEHIIENFADEYHGLVKKLERDRYLVIVEQRYMEKIVSGRFSILDAIREIDTGLGFPATLSIGVGYEEGNLHASEEISRQALDMALGRGGDQAAVRLPDGYQFFGGTARGIEKRNRVRARIMANAIAEVAKSSDNILIMGHSSADLDCLGASIGIMGAMKTFGIPCHIILDNEKSLARNLYNSYVADNPDLETRFLTPYLALEYMTTNTLCIIVDTHIPKLLESQDIYERSKNVIVIDHHRKMVEHIDNAMIFFHEPYASSACEMVTELIQYFQGGNYRPSIAEAEALLSGIMLDTKNFTIHTGVRTFEAAAYLRKMGADTIDVSQLFASSMGSYQERSRIVASANPFQNCAIAKSESNREDIRIIAGEAADDLLGIDGVEASFVLFIQNGKINISARSLGSLNVQIVMEALGGGGHLTMAGAQVENSTLDSVESLLKQELIKYWENNPEED